MIPLHSQEKCSSININIKLYFILRSFFQSPPLLNLNYILENTLVIKKCTLVFEVFALVQPTHESIHTHLNSMWLRCKTGYFPLTGKHLNTSIRSNHFIYAHLKFLVVTKQEQQYQRYELNALPEQKPTVYHPLRVGLWYYRPPINRGPILRSCCAACKAR